MARLIVTTSGAADFPVTQVFVDDVHIGTLHDQEATLETDVTPGPHVVTVKAPERAPAATTDWPVIYAASLAIGVDVKRRKRRISWRRPRASDPPDDGADREIRLVCDCIPPAQMPWTERPGFPDPSTAWHYMLRPDIPGDAPCPPRQ